MSLNVSIKCFLFDFNNNMTRYIEQNYGLSNYIIFM